MAGLGVENEKRKEVFTHLIPRQAMLNHIDLKALIEKRLAGGKMSSSDDIKKLLPESARHISVLREITRRWVRPEEFDFQKNAIARIVQRGGKVATVSQHREKILSGSVEPNFWLGGRESIFYRALGIKAELSIQRGENLHTKLRALRDAGALQPQDIVLVSYRDPYKDDLFMRWDDYDRIRLVAGHLEKLLDPTSVTWVETTQTRFAYTALKKNKVPIPFLFEQTLAIEPAFHKHISREGVYLDAGLQRRGLGLYLLEQGRRIFEEYFDGFSISTVVGNLLTAQTFHAFYDADLDDGIKGARVSAYAIDLAVELDLIDHRVAGRLSDEAFNSDWADISRERLTYFLRQKWGGAGVNALARIVAHLERLSGIKGKGWVNNLLLESGVLSVMGKVRKSSPMAYFDDEITKVLDAAA